ncbi:CrcB family protein [Methylonatrum kenyense]|uniref:fluoride efflux transporter FluC n=1 Tax=Methylonatrum kenyense TaxID=455253 RepID=UPI0020BD99D8|nr:CrcB family protein [Methylonatrum kenyense]MCK8515584.1 CrcB family protein [Methylonatrum kenyense]
MKTAQEMLAVAIGSILGGGLRLALSSWPLLQSTAFPWPTLVANLVGSFLMGHLAGRLSQSASGKKALLAPFVLTGFCGGLTTFSIFSLETIVMLEDGRLLAALSYIALSLTAAIAGAWAGQERRWF